MKITSDRLRLDRALTLRLFGPLRRLTNRRESAFSILMYHGIAAVDERGVPPYYRLNTSPAAFARQMRFLSDNGYRVLSLGQALANAAQDDCLLANSVVLTFDDGLRDFYTDAFPVLKEYGFTATVFLPTGYIGRVDKRFKGRECLSWPEVRELHRAGIDFGAHTVSHPQLRTLAGDLVAYEIRSSLATIADQLGTPTESFSYPYRFPEIDQSFTAYVRSLLAEAGCKYGVSTRIGRSSAADERYFLKRLPVNSADDIRLFQAKLAGDYDWLQYLQQAKKYLHS